MIAFISVDIQKWNYKVMRNMYVSFSRCYQIVFPNGYSKLYSHKQHGGLLPASSPDLDVTMFFLLKIFHENVGNMQYDTSFRCTP